MTSNLLIDNVGNSVTAGAISFAFCRAFELPSAFFNTVAVTALVAYRNLAESAFEPQQGDDWLIKPQIYALIASTYLLGSVNWRHTNRLLKITTADYLQIIGLATVAHETQLVLSGSYKMLRS